MPYEFVKVISAVGNSTNAAIAAARLDLTQPTSPIKVMTRLEQKSRNPENDGVSVDYVISHKDMVSNIIMCWYGTDRTIWLSTKRIRMSCRRIYYQLALPEFTWRNI